MAKDPGAARAKAARARTFVEQQQRESMLELSKHIVPQG
jgi:hypothetical protein